MIDTNKLEEKDRGRWIIYTGGAGEKEIGRLKSWKKNGGFGNIIYVVFRCDGNWNHFANYTGEGCVPEDLDFFDVLKGAKECEEHYFLPSGGALSSAEEKTCQDCGEQIGGEEPARERLCFHCRQPLSVCRAKLKIGLSDLLENARK